MQSYTLPKIQEKLTEKDIKPTQQRLIIYQALCEMSFHPTAEEVFAKIRPQNPTISLGTVYKTLELFLEKEILKKIPTEQNFVRYDINTTHHHHIFYENTNEIIDFEDEELNNLLVDFFAKKQFPNFTLKQIQVQVNGTRS